MLDQLAAAIMEEITQMRQRYVESLSCGNAENFSEYMRLVGAISACVNANEIVRECYNRIVEAEEDT